MGGSRANHLQIVGGKSVLELTRSAVRKKAHQLALSFPSPDTLLALDGALLVRETFLVTINQSPPAWLFDLRSSPRFDRLIGSREHAFALFDAKDVQYVDVLGIAGPKGRDSLQRNPVQWMPVIQAIVQRSPRKRGPFLALFEGRHDLLNGAPYLASALSSAVGRNVELSTGI
jgi:hypothetical protein